MTRLCFASMAVTHAEPTPASRTRTRLNNLLICLCIDSTSQPAELHGPGQGGTTHQCMGCSICQVNQNVQVRTTGSMHTACCTSCSCIGEAAISLGQHVHLPWWLHARCDWVAVKHQPVSGSHLLRSDHLGTGSAMAQETSPVAQLLSWHVHPLAEHPCRDKPAGKSAPVCSYWMHVQELGK